MIDRKKHKFSTNFIMSTLMMISALILFYSILLIFKPVKHSSNMLASFNNKESEVDHKRATRAKVDVRKVWPDSAKESKEKINTVLTAKGESNGQTKVSESITVDISKQLQSAYDLVDTGNPLEAQRVLEQILVKDPTNEEALIELGYIHLIDHGDPVKAQEVLGKVVENNPKDALIMSDYVGLCKENGESQLCLDKIQKSLIQNPDNAVANRGVGELQLSQENYEAAIDAFREAAEKSNSPDDYLSMSKVYDKSGDNGQAIEQRKLAEIKLEEQKRSGTGPYAVDNHLYKEKMLEIKHGLFKLYVRNGETEEAENIKKEIMKDLYSQKG